MKNLLLYVGLDNPSDLTNHNYYIGYDGIVQTLKPPTKKQTNIKIYLKGQYKYSQESVISLAKFVKSDDYNLILTDGQFPLEIFKQSYKLNG